MLQNIRRKFQGAMAKVIVAIIVVPFALFGIESLIGGASAQNVAEVNGVGISATDLQQQINQQKRRLLDAMGDNIDPAMLDDQRLAGPSLEFLIRKELMIQVADDYGLAVSDEHMGEVLGNIDVFHVDGRFDMARYRQFVSDRGYSPAGFQKVLREDLVMGQLNAGLTDTEFATPREIEQMGAINDERRDVRYLLLTLDGFREGVELTDEAVQAWYEDNQDRFVTDETVGLEYIDLKMEDFREPIPEDRLREVFEAERDSFDVAEQRRLSHILLEQREGETDEQLQTRIADVQALLAGDDSFEDVAADHSDDIGTASLGGDLGFTEGDSFPPELESALSEMTLDQVSEPVESDAGWHILKLTEILEGKTADFDTVREDIETRLQDEEARLALVQKVEDLRDLVFNADDLAGPAAELELEVQRGEGVKRSGNEGLFGDTRLTEAAFGEEVLNEGYNSSVIELAPEHFVVLRVVEHALPEARPLEEVRTEVESGLTDELAGEQIREKADELLSRLAEGASVEELAKEGDYEWQVELGARRDNATLPADLLRRLFELPAPGEGASSFEYVSNAEGDVELFELVRIVDGDAANLEESERDDLSRELRESRARQADDSYQQWLVEDASIVRSS